MKDSTDFELAFSAAPAVEGDWDEVWSLRVEPAGHLDLKDGRILVGDPLTGALSDSPLERAAPPGRYPVDLSVVRRPALDGEAIHDERVAAARIRFSDAPIARWEPARFHGQAASEPDEQPGFGVDAGTACFACAVVAPALDNEEAGDALLAVLERSGVPTWATVPHPTSPDAVIAFSSGWGDGFYVSWWGLDAEGAPVALITDFNVLTQPVWESFSLELPLPHGSAKHPLLDRMRCKLWRPCLSWSPQLVHAGPALPRIRAVSDGVATPLQPGVKLGHGRYSLKGLPAGTQLEVSYVTGQRPARRLYQ